MRNDGFEALVDRYPIGFVAQGFRQRTPDMQIFRHDDGTRVYGVPKKPAVFAEPRENPLPIRRQQPSRIQIAADTDHAVAFFQRVKRVGKSVIIRVKQGVRRCLALAQRERFSKVLKHQVNRFRTICTVCGFAALS